MKLPRISFLIIAILMLGLSFGIVNNPVNIFADDDDLEKIEKDIEKTQSKIGDLSEKIAKIKDEVNNLSGSLSQILSSIATIEAEINNINDQVSEVNYDINSKSAFLTTQTVLRDRTLRNFYKKGPNNVMVAIVQSNSLLATGEKAEYLKKYFDDSLDVIYEINSDITINRQNRIRLEELRAEVLGEKTKLEQIKADTEQKLAQQQADLSSKNEALGSLNQKLEGLLSRQREIIGLKLSTLNLPSSLGAGTMICTDDRKIDPGFDSGFAFYTYGIPHRVGMNQYGAYGRAKDGQSYDKILKAYFNFDNYKDVSGVTIKVNDGNGIGSGNVIWTGSLDEYVDRIYEVPSSWPAEALKAQAIAARSYVLAVTANGSKSICATQSCQVFKKEAKGGDWANAVSSTKGKVMVKDGQIITAWFASTSGGYTFTSAEVWGGSRSWTKGIRDTSGDVNSFSDLNKKAYDKDSKCFYAAQGWRSKYGNSAWLKPEEVADIANVILLVRKNSSNACFVYQVDKDPPKPDGSCPETGNWSAEKVRDKLGSDAIKSATSVEVTEVNWDRGVTEKIKINGVSFSGDEFKNYFNLRAPANIQIVGPLYNVEKL